MPDINAIVRHNIRKALKTGTGSAAVPVPDCMSHMIRQP